MILPKLKNFLDGKGVRYITLEHSPAYTAQELAAKMHVHGWELAKTTILKLDGKPAMAVLPAPCRVDFEQMRQVSGARTVELALEEEVEALFPDVEVGTVPPF